MELCKLNRNSELMYVQAVLPMDMARGLRGLSRRLVTKEQKIANNKEIQEFVPNAPRTNNRPTTAPKNLKVYFWLIKMLGD